MTASVLSLDNEQHALYITACKELDLSIILLWYFKHQTIKILYTNYRTRATFGRQQIW